MAELYNVICVGQDAIYRPARTDVKVGDRVVDPETDEPIGAQTPKGQEMAPVFHKDISRKWRQPEVGPGKGVLQITWQGVYDQAGLDLLDAQPAAQCWVVWAGNPDGSPKGVTISIDDDGNEITRGTPDYPGDAVLPGSNGKTRLDLLLEITPDIVTFENGTVKSRRRPLVARDAINIYGWAPTRKDLL